MLAFCVYPIIFFYHDDTCPSFSIFIINAYAVEMILSFVTSNKTILFFSAKRNRCGNPTCLENTFVSGGMFPFHWKVFYFVSVMWQCYYPMFNDLLWQCKSSYCSRDQWQLLLFQRIINDNIGTYGSRTITIPKIKLCQKLPVLVMVHWPTATVRNRFVRQDDPSHEGRWKIHTPLGRSHRCGVPPWWQLSWMGTGSPWWLVDGWLVNGW